MSLNDKLKNYHLILASASPRRQELLKQLDIDFKVQLKPVTEKYPKHLKSYEITNYLARLKAMPFKESLAPKTIIITSDTIVWHNKQAIGKPKNATEAFKILKTLNNTTHKVITSVCFTSCKQQKIVHASTKVTFKPLTDAELNYYVQKYEPYDKAGAYGIQDWIGYIGISKIKGSYYNVMGLPTDLVYTTLIEFL